MKKNEKKCKSCIHRAHLMFGDDYWACMYLLDTGKTRPCGIGEECTVYKRGKASQSSRRTQIAIQNLD